jgi:hypothetical protein
LSAELWDTKSCATTHLPRSCRVILSDEVTPVKISGVSEQPAATPEQPSRYNRTFGGLLAAMVATVVFVAAYVGFRALTRDQPEIEPESVHYLSCVADLQQAGTTVTYPLALPAGWIDTSVHFERGSPPTWRMGILTDRGEFVGVVQADDDVDDLVSSYVGDGAGQGEDASPANTLGATTWQTWSDDGGDHAYSTELGAGPLAGQTLLVYGSAPVEDQEGMIDLLTQDPVPPDAGRETCVAPLS